MTLLPAAKKIANTIVAELLPHCRVIDIAGSIRRNKAEVKDIEICCIPKTKTTNPSTLFERLPAVTELEPGFIRAVNDIGKVIKGKPTGKYMQILIERPFPINLDLFIPDDFDYYRQFAIRTGSADYSYAVLAVGWRKMGWCGSDKGLRRMIDCEPVNNKEGKQVGWKCIRDDYKPPFWRSEQAFFEWLGVPYKEPRFRELT